MRHLHEQLIEIELEAHSPRARRLASEARLNVASAQQSTTHLRNEAVQLRRRATQIGRTTLQGETLLAEARRCDQDGNEAEARLFAAKRDARLVIEAWEGEGL
jgi:hypothetical protein